MFLTLSVSVGGNKCSSDCYNLYKKYSKIWLISDAVLSFVPVCRYRKKGRGYITLDDFGNYEGMQNPNYDGEL